MERNRSVIFSLLTLIFSVASLSVVASSSLARSSSSFVAVSSSLALDQSTSVLPSVSSALVSSSAVPSPSVDASSSIARSSSSFVAVSPSLGIDQSTSVLPSVSSVLVSSSAVAPPSVVVSSSLARNGSSTVAVSSSLAIDQSTSVIPSVSSVLVSSSLPGIGATTNVAPSPTTKTPISSSSSACFSGEFLTGSSGFFSSPNFPNNYPQNSTCTWNITVPSGYIIKISFLHFQLGYIWRGGAQLTITNFPSGVVTLDGYSLPDPVYSVGNSIQVTFISLANQYSGFNASYTAITFESVCPDLMTLNDTSGVITSPYYRSYYLGYYPANRTCSWQITASKGKRIKLVIEDMYFYLWYGQTCTYHYLEIQNGSFSSDGVPAGRMCGYLMGGVTFYSFHETLKVLFVGRRWQRYSGFRATYTQLNNTASSECSNYRFLEESNRARAYSGITNLCDTTLSGWYRFSGAAGSQMAESCVNRGHCGTDAPGWLNGSHPAVADGAVQRRVCFTHFNNCCHYSTYISVRNCGRFYAYKLDRPPHCSLRYCGNGIPLAPECYNYRLINESNRARTYGDHNHLCDDKLSVGWYRFSGGAGNQMAESCVHRYHCGTQLPGWLNGSHPAVDDGAVQRRVCFSYYCYCTYSIYISVRNCGGFYVYKLKPVTLCNLRYCGNGFVPPTPVTPVKTSPLTTEIITKPATPKTSPPTNATRR